MVLRYQMRSKLARRLNEIEARTPGFTVSLIRVLAVRATSTVALRNRVDTGRSRIAWTPIFQQPWAGQQAPASDVPSKGKSGRHSSSYVQRARAEGKRKGRFREKEGRSYYRASVVNAVHYVKYLDENFPYVSEAFQTAFRKWKREIRREMRREFGR